ncbi:MAG: phosphoesterase, partial [Candidatus Aenigmatarchaeota archaeon]
MRFELHCHTLHSRISIPCGLEKPSEVVKQAAKVGLDGIAITDHDTTNGWDEARKEAKKQGIMFIPGIEVSSGMGHILGLGVSEGVPSNMGIGETVDQIRERGGIAIAAHPFDIRGHGIRHRLSEADAAEAFNALSLDRVSNR